MRFPAFAERLPRMRGDRPDLVKYLFSVEPFTPHARGSTFGFGNPGGLGYVYPACAGIDRVESARTTALYRLPRMRGDRPWY